VWSLTCIVSKSRSFLPAYIIDYQTRVHVPDTSHFLPQFIAAQTWEAYMPLTSTRSSSDARYAVPTIFHRRPHPSLSHEWLSTLLSTCIRNLHLFGLSIHILMYPWLMAWALVSSRSFSFSNIVFHANFVIVVYYYSKWAYRTCKLFVGMNCLSCWPPSQVLAISNMRAV